MISRKIVTGEREMLAQIYLKKGALVPMHSHESEQMTYVLQGALKFLVGGEEITVREGEVLHIPSWVEHQAEALDDTFELDLFSPIRQDWLDHTDTYFTSKSLAVGAADCRLRIESDDCGLAIGMDHRRSASVVSNRNSRSPIADRKRQRQSPVVSATVRPSPIGRRNTRRTCGAAGSSSTSGSGT